MHGHKNTCMYRHAQRPTCIEGHTFIDIYTYSGSHARIYRHHIRKHMRAGTYRHIRIYTCVHDIHIHVHANVHRHTHLCICTYVINTCIWCIRKCHRNTFICICIYLYLCNKCHFPFGQDIFFSYMYSNFYFVSLCIDGIYSVSMCVCARACAN